MIRERGQEKLLLEVEQPLAKVLSRMEKVGFKVDINGLMSFSSKLGRRRRRGQGTDIL